MKRYLCVAVALTAMVLGAAGCEQAHKTGNRMSIGAARIVAAEPAR